MIILIQPERDYARGEEARGLLGQDDERAYCILAERGLTPLHCDEGCQGVVYVTLSGKNRICGVPREVAQPFQVAREMLLDYDGLEWATEAFFAQAEARLLKACLDYGVLW